MYNGLTIETIDNITKITKKDGIAVTVLTDQEGYSNLKARLPYKSEVSHYDSTNKTNAYLYDYLNQSGTIQYMATGLFHLVPDILTLLGVWTMMAL